MTSFDEYMAAFNEADRAIASAETLAGQIEDGEKRSNMAGTNDDLLVGLGLIAVARAIQANTLGIRSRDLGNVAS